MIVLVVDDERYVREEIAHILKALPHAGALTIHYAKDGAQALELALLTPPDLLLTDVRMPRMDGLALAEQIHSLMPACSLVFLSNYSDKEYLLRAIRLQVVDYIDKPLLREKLPALVERLYFAYQKKKADLLDTEERIRANTEDARKILSHLWASMLRHKGANLESVRQQCSRYGMDFFYQAAYRCVFLKLSQSSDTCAAETALPFGFLKESQLHLLPCDSSNPRVQIFFLYASDIALLSDDMLNRFFQTAQEYVQSRSADCRDAGYLGMAAGPAAASCRDAFRSYQLAQYANNRLYFTDSPKLLLLNERPATPLSTLSQEKCDLWMSAMLDLNTAGAKQAMNHIFASLYAAPDTPVEDIQAYFCSCAQRMLSISSDNLLEFHNHHDVSSLQRQIIETANIQQLEALLNSWVEELMDCGVGENRIGRTMLAYIHRNYKDPELGLERLCSFTGYSRGYLCRVFQKVVGEKVGNYIIHIRMNQACQLLENTKKNLDEIARAVGYDNSKYFGQAFKRYMGMTPLDYRKSRQSDPLA